MRQTQVHASRLEASWHRILHREEQRTSARHVAVVNSAWIAWEDPTGRILSEDATLLDISRGGASVQVVRFAPYRSVWLCIEAGGKVWGVRFETVEEHANPETGNRLRGRFPDRCPEGFYRVALRGYREKVEPQAGRTRADGGFLAWVKDRMTRRVRPTMRSAPDVGASREQAVRELADGAFEVELRAPCDEASAKPGREITATGEGMKVSLTSEIPD
ncbi:MAG: hypothetical protein U0800_09975 [Isosphaeraceae bacterium]